MNTSFKMSLLCLASACLFFIFFVCFFPHLGYRIPIVKALVILLLILGSLASTGITGIYALYLSFSRREFIYTILPLIGFLIIYWSFGVYIKTMPPNPGYRIKVNDNLKQLHMLMMMYAQDWNSFPKVTPEGGNGVRDLYPLYTTDLLYEQALSILQPPNSHLQPFSKNPTIEEFDKDHIGFSYNSTATYNETNTVPLLADQGVSSGYLQLKTDDNGIKAREKKGAVVLFTSGRIEFITADKNGRLSTYLLSKADWSLLKD